MRSYYHGFQAFLDKAPPTQAYIVQLYWNAEDAANHGAQVFDGFPTNVIVDMPKKRDYFALINQICYTMDLIEFELGATTPIAHVYPSLAAARELDGRRFGN